jgi:CheY-like chemotaxis protein
LERILGAVPTRDEARRFLRGQASAYLGGKSPAHAAADDAIETWSWDPQRKEIVSRRVRSGDASLVLAARIAHELFVLDPDDPETRRLYLAATLGAAKVNYGLNHSLPVDRDPLLQSIARQGSVVIGEVLDWSMEKGYRESAIGAAEILGRIGDPDAVRSTNGRPTPLSRALEHADRHVRFAALEAVLTIDPRAPFAGSSRVPEAISYFVRSSSQRAALVAHPSAEVAATLAGMLSGLGFDAQIATNGRDLVLRAERTPDCEFILMSEFLTHPDANETLQAIRLDYRSARIPVAVLSDDGRSRLAALENDPLTMVYPPPQSPPIASRLVRLLLERERQTDADQRVAQASAALDWLRRLAEKPRVYEFYDLLRAETATRDALASAALTDKAAPVLGLLATPGAQLALVDLASQNARPAADRRAAAIAFASAVRKRGVLLTTDQITRQYDRYNNSAALDQETQQILGSILDTLEASAEKQQTSGRGSRVVDEASDSTS